MTDFQPAFQKLMELEHGYSAHDVDRGAVKDGITQAWLDQVEPGRKVEDLDAGDVMRLYKQRWFDAGNFIAIPDQRLGTAVFVEAVNVGMKPAIQWLQRTLDALGQDVMIDGIIGPQTVGALDRLADADLVLRGFLGHCAEYYGQLVAGNPKKYGQYLRGWLRRLLAL